jgi:hypothetical protein
MTRSLAVGAIVLSVCLAPSQAPAQTRLVTFTPSLTIGSIYDNNLFARTVGTGDQMTVLAPGAEASYSNPRAAILGFYTFDMQRSLNHPALNQLAGRRHGLIDGHYRQTEKLSFAMIGRYDFTQTAGDLNFNAPLLLAQHQALRWEVNPSVAYQLRQRTSIAALYDRTTERIIGDTSAFEDIARFTVTRQKTPRYSFGVGYSMRHFINGDETHTSNAVLFGSTYAFTPATTLTMAVGPRLSSRNTLEPDITATYARRQENGLGYSVDIWRGESIILGVVGPVEVLSTTAGVLWPYRPTIQLGVRGGLFDSTTLSQGQARVYHAEAVAAWSPRGPWILAAAYGADFQHGDVRTSLLADQNIVRHLFQVRLTLAPRLSRTIQPDDPLRPLGEPTKGVQR